MQTKFRDKKPSLAWQLNQSAAVAGKVDAFVVLKCSGVMTDWLEREDGSWREIAGLRLQSFLAAEVRPHLPGSGATQRTGPPCQHRPPIAAERRQAR